MLLINLIQCSAVSEQADEDDCYQKDAQCDEMSGEIHEIRSPQYDAADNNQEMGQGKNIAYPLRPFRHAWKREHEAGKQE